MIETMKPELWQVVQRAVRKAPASDWVQRLTRLDFEGMQALPVLEEPLAVGHYRPGYERVLVTQDYLAFLRSQIHLAPRGKAWAEVLANRVQQLQPFVDLELDYIHLNYFDGTHLHTATFVFNPATGHVIFWD